MPRLSLQNKDKRRRAIREAAQRLLRPPRPAPRPPRLVPDLVPAKLRVNLSPAMVNATGQVPCLKRMGDGIARDRCMLYQQRGCSCEIAGVVRDAFRLNRGWEREELMREERARRAPGRRFAAGSTKYPPWNLVCSYCGTPFTYPRVYGQKPRYDTDECRIAAENQRRKANKAARLAAGQVTASGVR